MAGRDIVEERVTKPGIPSPEQMQSDITCAAADDAIFTLFGLSTQPTDSENKKDKDDSLNRQNEEADENEETTAARLFFLNAKEFLSKNQKLQKASIELKQQIEEIVTSAHELTVESIGAAQGDG